MSDDLELYELLRCPETHEPLLPVTRKWIDRVNKRIARGDLRTQSGALVEHAIDDGLVTYDDRYLYPVRDGLPNLFVADRIVLST